MYLTVVFYTQQNNLYTLQESTTREAWYRTGDGGRKPPAPTPRNYTRGFLGPDRYRQSQTVSSSSLKSLTVSSGTNGLYQYLTEQTPYQAIGAKFTKAILVINLRGIF